MAEGDRSERIVARFGCRVVNVVVDRHVANPPEAAGLLEQVTDSQVVESGDPDGQLNGSDRRDNLRRQGAQPALGVGPLSLHALMKTFEDPPASRNQQTPILRLRTLVVTDPVAETANPACEVVPRLLHALPQTVDDRLTGTNQPLAGIREDASDLIREPADPFDRGVNPPAHLIRDLFKDCSDGVDDGAGVVEELADVRKAIFDP